MALLKKNRDMISIFNTSDEGKKVVFSPLTKTVETYLNFCGNKHNISDYFVEI